MNKSKLSREYRTAIDMEFDGFNGIIVDFEKDLNNYQGLDENIYIQATDLSDDEREKFKDLCEICPKIRISDELGLGKCTVQEYKNGEKWISTVLEGIESNWSDIQKIAYVDNQIGKKISYSPDFDTEIFSPIDARTLWKIIDTGYGVCNGIAQVEQYILGRIGINSLMVTGKNHTFLKLSNIETENKKGEKVKGNTILDPTWNLTAHRYGCKPLNFCRSYEQIRKQDIKDGKDKYCHKNDEMLEDATLDLGEESLRKIFKSIGVTDKDGFFPIRNLVSKYEDIDKLKLSGSECIKKQLQALVQYCPEFCACHNSTLGILGEIIIENKNLQFDECILGRVYEKNDKTKQPVLYLYINLSQEGRRFYFADKENKEFTELDQKDFEKRFECYEQDIERNNGIKPWKKRLEEHIIGDLSKKPEEISNKKGEDR